MTNDEQIEILRKAGYFKDGEDVFSLLAAIDSLQNKIKEVDAGWKVCWSNYKDILNLSIDMMDSVEIVADYEDSITVKFDRELYETFEDQVAQMADLPGLNDEE